MNKLLLTCACATALALSTSQTVNAQDYTVQDFKDFHIIDPEFGDELNAAGFFQHVSSNGKFAVGYDDAKIMFNLGGAFLWQLSDPTELTPLGTTYNRISACDVSNDGIIVGSFEQRENEEKESVAYPGWRTITGDWHQLPTPKGYSLLQATNEDFSQEARAITGDGKYIVGHTSIKVGEKTILEGKVAEILRDCPILWEKKGDSYVINTVFNNLGQAGHNKLYVDGKLVEQADSATFTQFFVRDISDDGKTIVGLNVAGSGGFNPAFIRDGELVQLFNCGEEDNGEEEEGDNQIERNFNGGTILSIDGEGNMYGYYADAAELVHPFIFTNDNKLVYVDEIYTCAGGGKKFTQTETDLHLAMCCSNDGKVIAGAGLGSDPRIGNYNYPVIKYESTFTAVKNIENIRNHVSISYAGGNLVYINGEYTSAKVYAANGALVATVAQGTPANLAGKAAGTYIVKVETAKGEKTFKIVK